MQVILEAKQSKTDDRIMKCLIGTNKFKKEKKIVELGESLATKVVGNVFARALQLKLLQ